LPLYSQPKQPRLHTSAKPCWPSMVVPPFSNVYVAPEKSSDAGWGSPSTSQSSRKCIWAPARSVRPAQRHLLTKSGKVKVGI